MIKLLTGLLLILSFTSNATSKPNYDYKESPESQMRTSSGLGISIFQEGSGGRKPLASDTVTVHYEGKLMSGKVFDNSYSRGKPATFALNRVISGWTEGLQYMQVGSKYRFVIPAHLAYGQRGVPGVIPANATLVFNIELISIQ